jgi:hypothetical protein
VNIRTQTEASENKVIPTIRGFEGRKQNKARQYNMNTIQPERMALKT